MPGNKHERLFTVEEIDHFFDFTSSNPLLQSVFSSENFKSKESGKDHDFPTLYKMLMLQRLFDIEADRLHYTIADRRSWMAFLNTTDASHLPPLNVLDEFRQKLRRTGIYDQLFSQFDRDLARQGIVLHRGRIRDLFAVSINRSNGDRPDPRNQPETERISEINFPGIPHPIWLRTATSDERVFREIILERGYDFEIRSNPEFILDCGANIGLASIFFKSRFPSARIVAVEPEDSNFRLLEHNLSYYYPHAQCLRNGIWNCNTELSVKNSSTGDKWAFIVGKRESTEETGVTSVTIAEIMKRYNRESIDILKVDIEGAELELFSSNYEYWLPRTKAIMIETHDQIRKGCSQALFRALANFDYSVSYIGNTILCVRETIKTGHANERLTNFS